MSENKNTKTSADGGTGFNYFRASTITVLRQALVDADDTSQKRVDEMVKTEHEWVGLTDEEIHDLIYVSQKIDASNSPWFDCLGFYRAIEAKLREKNT
jgi:hypothetical protein